MARLRQLASAAAALALSAVILCAQTPPPGGAIPGRGGRGGMATPANALRSPEVNADRTVTFRFRAPEATQVQLVGEIMQGKPPHGSSGLQHGRLSPVACCGGGGLGYFAGPAGGGAEERIIPAERIRLLSKRMLCTAQRSMVGRTTGGLYIRLCAVWKPTATEETAITNIAK